jgi:hypothetical protein
VGVQCVRGLSMFMRGAGTRGCCNAGPPCMQQDDCCTGRTVMPRLLASPSSSSRLRLSLFMNTAAHPTSKTNTTTPHRMDKCGRVPPQNPSC